MTRNFLGYGRQAIDDADIAAVVGVLRGNLLTQGPTVERFEKALAERVGARYAVAVANGTAALHIACLAADLGPSDLALVPTLTFVATANAPFYCGASTHLADIDATSRALTAETVASFVTHHPETKAILPVHFSGLASSMPEIRKAAEHRMIIEDACHALGGTYPDGKPVGCCDHSDMAAFSFHPVKPITTGEGGAVTTNDRELARRLKLFRNHGIERDPARFIDSKTVGPWSYEQQVLGFNYRMTDLQAALGLSQLDRLEYFRARRKEITDYYDSRFSGLDNLTLPQSKPNQRAHSGLHLYQVDIDFNALGRPRVDVMSALRNVGIGTQVHYIPIHQQPFHKSSGRYHNDAFPIAERHYAQTLSIPLFPSMTDEDVEFVVDSVSELLT